MRGKYSPTVSFAYGKDYQWWDKYSGTNDNGWHFPIYDPEGFDSYGYNVDGVDREGNAEADYYPNDSDDWDNDDADYNIAYDKADAKWGFDGIKPSLLK